VRESKHFIINPNTQPMGNAFPPTQEINIEESLVSPGMAKNTSFSEPKQKESNDKLQ